MTLVGVVMALLGGDPAAEAIAAFRKEYRSDVAEDRRVAAVARVSVHRDSRVSDLLAPLLTSESPAVRIVVAARLGGFSGVEEVSGRLLAALKHRKNDCNSARGVRVTILRSLGDLRAKDAAAEVDKRIEDRDAWVAKAAIEAAGKIRARSSVESLVKALKRLEGPAGRCDLPEDALGDEVPRMTLTGIIRDDKSKRSTATQKTRAEVLRDPVMKALQSITRVEHYNAGSWSEWWSKNKSMFEVPP